MDQEVLIMKIDALQGVRLRLQCVLEDDENVLYLDVVNQNPWFVKANVQRALRYWIENLEPEKILFWIGSYNIDEPDVPKTIGLVAAGNIPMVSFHDLLCIFLSGNKSMLKLSSNDGVLMSWVSRLINEAAGEEIICFVERMVDFDAVIATGSNNSSRYFEYYFAKYPRIIRKNRTSLAVLSGNETSADLTKICDDILSYFGLGCRNVSKIFIPKGYDIRILFENMSEHKKIQYHHKYFNNFEYNLAVLLVNRADHFANEYLLLSPSKDLRSSIAQVFFDTYESKEEVLDFIEKHKEDIQTVVSKETWLPHYESFGEAQNPSLSNYADGVDTMEFLLALD